MPGGDGTGPPMRGAGRGRGRGRGRGWGRHGWGWVGVPGRGRGRGRGRGWGWADAGAPADDVYPDGMPNLTPQQEADMLREQARAMQDEIKAINQRINELESLKKKNK